MNNIDPKMSPLVMHLQLEGFNTSGSCQGGPGHPFEKPYVCFLFPKNKVEKELKRLEAFLEIYQIDCELKHKKGSNIASIILEIAELDRFNRSCNYE